MKKIYILFLLIIPAASLFAQLFNNQGADIYVKNGGFVIVKTNSVYNNLSAGAGRIDNQGTIVVEGYIQNDGIINGNGDTIRLLGDWINNNAYTGANSWVDMYGGNQLITGTAVTTYDNLNLGGGAVVKRQTINSVTASNLRLNDAELATDSNEMYVSNTSLGAISWNANAGFVSSLGPGRLSRATNQSAVYIYPVGSPSYNNPPSIYRPIDFTPATAAPNIYGACLVKGDATLDGFNVNTLDTILCKVNPHFYHRLYHTAGADAASLKMFFNPATDDVWTDQGHWDAPNQWNYLGLATSGTGLGFSSVSVGGVSDFNPEPFALARKKFIVDAGPDVIIYEGQSTDLNPTINTISIGTVDWTPSTTLSCPTCANTTATPPVTTMYNIEVVDDAGCIAHDSLIVTVIPSELLIPTAFSPNGDGVNDIFRTLNKNLVKYNLQVYNRWGEKLFETSDPLQGWDGTFKGLEQQLGVYVWECEYMFYGNTKTKLAKGNVTLMR